MSERMSDERWHEIGSYRSVEMAWGLDDQMEIAAELDRARVSEAALLAALKDVVMKVDQRWLDLDQARAAIAEAEGREP
jgi:hypothetical protein